MDFLRKYEEWRDVLGYEGLYKISTHGRVESVPRLEQFYSKRWGKTQKRFRKSKILKPRLNNSGYLVVNLYSKGTCSLRYIHRLVAEKFCPKRGLDVALCEVNHLSGDKLDNFYKNLEWSSRQKNSLHSTRVLKKNRGESVGTSKLLEKDVLQIVNLLELGCSQTEVGKMFGVSNHAIYRVANGDNWAWLTGLGKEGN